MEVQGKMDHHAYVNILQQHLLASAVDIFDNQKPDFVFYLDSASHRQGHRFPDLVTRISNRGCYLDIP